jgi:hypothetical protein
MQWTFRAKPKSPRGLGKLSCPRPAALRLEEVMTKEKTQGGELIATGKQTMPHAYSAMDYYFDHFKKDRRIGTFGRIRIRRESESLCGEEHCRHPGICEGAELREGYSRYASNSDGIHANAIGSLWRAG